MGGGQNLSDSRRMTQFWKSLIRTKNKRKGHMILMSTFENSLPVLSVRRVLLLPSSCFSLWVNGYSPTKSEESAKSRRTLSHLN